MKSLGTVTVLTALCAALAGCGSVPAPSAAPPLGSSPGRTARRAEPVAPRGRQVSASMADATTMSAIHFVSKSRGWLAGNGRIWMTTDGGAQWNQVYQGAANFHGIQFVNSQTGWAWSDRTLIATTDGGNIWHQQYRGVQPIISFSMMSQRTGYAILSTPSAPFSPGGPGNALYVTNDGGEKWQVLSTPFHPMAIAFANSQDGWAVGDSQIWHTTDAGREWMPVYLYGTTLPMRAELRLAGNDTVWVLLQGASGMSQTSYTVLHYSPAHGWHVAAAKSTAGAGPAPDAPATAPGAPGLAPGPLAVVNATTAFLAGESSAVNLGATALWRTQSGGAQWTAYPTIYGVNGTPGPESLSFVSAKQGWLVSGLNATQVFETTTGGASWHQVFPPLPAPMRGVSFVSLSTGYGLGEPGHPNAVMMTRDGGQRWSPLSAVPASHDWQFDTPGSTIVFTHSETGWLVRNNHLWHTADGGKNWQPISLPNRTAEDAVNAVSFVGDDGVVGSPSSDTCWWTVNAGQTWNRAQRENSSQALADVNRVINLEANQIGQNLLAAGSSGPVYWTVFENETWAITTDGGTEWTLHTIPATVQGGIGTIDFVNAEDGWVESGTGQLFFSHDSGVNWQSLP